MDDRNLSEAVGMTEQQYNFIHKPKHYCVIGDYDVCDIANAVGLDQDAYAFNILKYVLRKNKPGEPRYRDIEKIREYADIWLRNYHRKELEMKKLVGLEESKKQGTV